MSKSKILLAFALGAAAGAAVAYYLNTEEGEETLRELKEATGKLRKDVESSVGKGKDIINDITSTAQSLLGNFDN